MSRVATVLLKPHLDDPDRETEQLAELAAKTGIDVARLLELDEGAENPRLSEIGALAEALDVDPIHLFRSSPVVAARRDNPEISSVGSKFLTALDLHLAAYLPDGTSEQNLSSAFQAATPWAARAAGEGWADRTDARGYAPGRPDDDPLIRAVESDLHVPVVTWPVPDAPFGATIRTGEVFVIWVNSYEVPETQQRFTLAHEVGHLLLSHVNADLLLEESRSVDLAVADSSPIRREAERHAQHFASGVMADRDKVLEHWLHESSSRAVAQLSAELGVSFQATLVLLDRHLPKGEAEELREATRDVSVRSAFRAAELEKVYEAFMGERSRGHFSPLVPEPEILEMNLRRSLG